MTPNQRRTKHHAKLIAWKALRKTLPRSRPKEPKTPKGTRTRFSREENGVAKHSRDMIRLEVVRRHKAGETQLQIAKALGIPRTSVENWVGQSTLPRRLSSPYTFAKVLACVTLARNLYRQKFSNSAHSCLKEAVRRTPAMNWGSIRVYLSLEAVPAIAGFPLYADQAVQARCEALGRGERTRGTDIFDDPPMPPAPRAPEPSGPASLPLTRSPSVDRERFLASRYRLQLPRLRL